MKRLFGCFLCVMLLAFGIASKVKASPFSTADISVGKETIVVYPKIPETEKTITKFDLFIEKLSETDIDTITKFFLNSISESLEESLQQFKKEMEIRLLSDDIISRLYLEPQPRTFSNVVTQGKYIILIPPQYAKFYDPTDIPSDVSQILEGLGLQPVPEPTTMLLFGAGLVGLAGFGRKKFKK